MPTFDDIIPPTLPPGLTNTGQQLTDALNIGSDINTALTKAGQNHVFTGTTFGFRHFTFILNNQTGIGDAHVVVELNINPEDLQQDTPYRVNTTQTMGGAFVDVWGQGVRKLLFRGHTGWRRQSTTTQSDDGFENIFKLRDKIFNNYFDIREKASATFSHVALETQVKITLVDRLHQKAYRVIPENFRLLRNRTRPLLHMYEAVFVIVDDDGENADTTQTVLSSDEKTKVLWNGFSNSQDRFDSLTDKIKNIGGPFKDALTSVSTMGSGLAGMFKGLIKAKDKLATGIGGVRDVADTTTQAIHLAMGNIQSYADFSGMVADAKYIFNDVKSAVGDLECLIKDIQSFGLLTYRQVNGASACAALYGIPASPLAKTVNSFDAIKGGNTQQSLQTIANSISVSSQESAKKVLSIDTPLDLIGRGGL